ncbi:MAG TPA: DUF6796 family protein [Propionibacteriaceae bacterium]|nr:DUF6796 family protein [Propionibacteriaceae bacterium]
MFQSIGDYRGASGGRDALIGLAGAVLAGVGDVLILGRACSGSDFDRAAGVLQADSEVEDRWRSLWNGAVLPSSRIHIGTIIGNIGVAVVAWFGLWRASQTIEPGPERKLATGAAAAFAISGVATHWSCGSVILAYRRALQAAESTVAPPTSPRSVTRLLEVSAVASLGALAVLSVSLTAASLRGRSTTPIQRSAITPLPFVAATLATFGALPAPVGGYARPASISIGLAVYMTLVAISTRGDLTSGRHPVRSS